jgi:glutamine synthetase
MPEPTVDQDPETLSESERARRQIVRLPETLAAALKALEADPVAGTFLPEPLFAAYLGVKRAELELTRDWPPEEICRRYAEVY